MAASDLRETFNRLRVRNTLPVFRLHLRSSAAAVRVDADSPLSPLSAVAARRLEQAGAGDRRLGGHDAALAVRQTGPVRLPHGQRNGAARILPRRRGHETTCE